MSERRRRLSALAKLRTAYADKQVPRLRDAFAAVLKKHVAEYAALAEDSQWHTNGAKLQPGVLSRWARDLLDAQKRPMAFMAAHGFALAGDELHGTSHGKNFDGQFGKVKVTGVEVGDAPSNFLLDADWTNLDKWVKTTAESASATSATRLQNIFQRASDYWDEEKQQGFTPAKIAKLILSEGLTQCDVRAKMLAQTGAIWAYGEGAVQRYAAEGVAVMEWLTADDDLRCPFCAEMNGKKIKTGDSFFNAGDSLSLPDTGTLKIPGGVKGFSVNHPPLHPNCRCTLIPIVDEGQLDEPVVEEKPKPAPKPEAPEKLQIATPKPAKPSKPKEEKIPKPPKKPKALAIKPAPAPIPPKPAPAPIAPAPAAPIAPKPVESKPVATGPRNYALTPEQERADLEAAYGKDLPQMMSEFRDAAKRKGLNRGELTEQQAFVVWRYTGSDYRALNKALATKQTSAAQRANERLLNAALDKCPKHEGKVYRWLPVSDKAAFGAKHQANTTITWDAFASTSTSPTRTKSFGTDVCFIVNTKTGRVVEQVSQVKSEKEVLLQSGKQFKITRTKKAGQTLKVYLDEI